MGALRPLGLGRRPVTRRLLVLYRVGAGALAARLPPRTRPRLWRGHGVLAVCYTRLGVWRGLWLPQRFCGTTEHLAYRAAVEFEHPAGPRPGTWVLRRETSTWLGASWASRLQRGGPVRARFEVVDELLGVELRARSGDGEFHLRAEATPTWEPSLFRSARELEKFLSVGVLRPADVFTPEADDLELDGRVAAEPLRIHEVRSTLFGSGAPEGEDPIPDCAVRLTDHRTVRPELRARALRERAEPVEGTRPLPAH